MSGRGSDDALSEVIGFILIIAILVVIASLYVTYVVPAQGREAEIEHMTYIKDQFVDYKMSIDSLWINLQENVSLSQNIEMGTLGQKTEGQFVFLPLTNPIGSDGLMRVSNDISDGTIEIEINGLTKQLSSEEIESGITINPDIYRIQNYYQYSSPDIVSNMIPVIINDLPDDLNDFYENSEMSQALLTIEPNTSDSASGDWVAKVNISRVPTFKVPEKNWTFFKDNKNPIFMQADYQFDLVMTLMKNNETLGYPVFQNFTLENNIKEQSEPYWINLQDPAYGLDIYGPLEVKDDDGNLISGELGRYSGTSSSLNYTSFIDQIHSTYLDDSVISTSAMGKFSYIGNNYYWVPQEYYYQLGGVFLVQNLSEGSVAKALPLITLSKKDDNSPLISIINLHIVGEKSSVAGSTPVQVVSKVTGIRKGIIRDDSGDDFFLAPGSDNAQYARITIDNLPEETLQMWRNTFNSIIYEANLSTGFNTSWAKVPPSSGDATLEVYTGSGANDVTVDYTEANVSVLLQPVGWQGS